MARQMTPEELAEKRRKHAEYMRQYYRSNPEAREKHVAIVRAYRAKHRGTMAEINHKWYLKNRDKIREYNNAYNEKHREALRKRRMERYRRYHIPKPGLSKSEAARQLNVSRTTVYAMIYDGRLKINECGRVTEESVKEMQRWTGC